MYVVTCVSGQTGSVVASSLLDRGVPVRVVVRRAGAGEPWKARGAEVAVADLRDGAALAEALRGSTGAYLMNPPAYDVEMFTRAEEVAHAFVLAVRQASPGRVAVLSSVGAHLPTGTGNIRTTHVLERTLGDLSMVSFVRAAWFMENWKSGFHLASKDGVLPSFLSPAGRALPMVAARDIGNLIADTLTSPALPARVIELEGPRAYSPADVAAAFARALGREVTCAVVPEAGWDEALRPMRMHPTAVEGWKEMLRGFQSRHIVFEQPARSIVRGSTTVDDFAAMLAP